MLGAEGRGHSLHCVAQPSHYALATGHAHLAPSTSSSSTSNIFIELISDTPGTTLRALRFTSFVQSPYNRHHPRGLDEGINPEIPFFSNFRVPFLIGGNNFPPAFRDVVKEVSAIKAGSAIRQPAPAVKWDHFCINYVYGPSPRSGTLQPRTRTLHRHQQTDTHTHIQAHALSALFNRPLRQHYVLRSTLAPCLDWKLANGIDIHYRHFTAHVVRSLSILFFPGWSGTASSQPAVPKTIQRSDREKRNMRLPDPGSHHQRKKVSPKCVSPCTIEGL